MGFSSSITNETDRLRVDLSRARKLSVFLGFCLVLSLLTIWKVSGNHVTTIVPPEIKQSFWISHNKVSASYLEEMGSYVIQLSENYTPKNIDYKHNSLLKRVDPSSYSALKLQLEEKAEHVKRNDISSVFHESGVVIDEAKMIVHVRGHITMTVGKEVKDPVPATIAVHFGYTGGHISVKSIREVKR